MIDDAQQHIINHVDITAWIRRHGVLGILIGLAAWAVTAATGHIVIGVKHAPVK